VFDLIKTSAPCRERIRSGELRVVGAVYDIGTGTVEWLGEHPWQRELIAAMDARHAAHQAEVPETH
jgi:carbonic anhydrase